MPLREEKKWITNLPNGYLEGKENITNFDRIIITKARKCRIVLQKTLENVVNCQNESNSFALEENLQWLSQFKEVYINFDADSPGKKSSIALTKEHGWKWLNVPNFLVKQGIKDFSDWVKEDGDYIEVNKFLKRKKLIK